VAFIPKTFFEKFGEIDNFSYKQTPQISSMECKSESIKQSPSVELKIGVDVSNEKLAAEKDPWGRSLGLNI
jgi:hypothetical protein